jgi:hypothetical protein
MILKFALLLWLAAFVLMLIAKGRGRSWMLRFFLGGFCLLVLGFFLKLLSRVL